MNGGVLGGTGKVLVYDGGQADLVGVSFTDIGGRLKIEYLDGSSGSLVNCVGDGLNTLTVSSSAVMIPDAFPVSSLTVNASGLPLPRVRRRIGRQADGWFVLCSPEEFPGLRDDIYGAAESAGRNAVDIGMEAGVAVVGPREHEWQSRVEGWSKIGLTHICLRTLGGGLAADDHIVRMRQAASELPGS